MPRISNHAAWICGRDSKPVGPRLARDEIRSNGDREGTALPLPLAGEGWGGGAAAIQAVRVERASPTRIASFDAMRPPPQAGEVQRVRGQADSTKNHTALVHFLVRGFILRDARKSALLPSERRCAGPGMRS